MRGVNNVVDSKQLSFLANASVSQAAIGWRAAHIKSAARWEGDAETLVREREEEKRRGQRWRTIAKQKNEGGKAAET